MNPRIDIRTAWLALILTLAACSGPAFIPQDTPEGIAYAQEKLSVALDGIDEADRTGLITAATRVRLLDQAWQPAKDMADAALAEYARTGSSNRVDRARGMARSLVLELIRIGVLEQGAER